MGNSFRAGVRLFVEVLPQVSVLADTNKYQTAEGMGYQISARGRRKWRDWGYLWRVRLVRPRPNAYWTQPLILSRYHV